MPGLLDRDGFPTWFDAEMNGPGWYDENLNDTVVVAADTRLKPWQMQASMGAIVVQ